MQRNLSFHHLSCPGWKPYTQMSSNICGNRALGPLYRSHRVGIVRPEPVLGFGKLTSQGSLGQWLGILTPPTPHKNWFLVLLLISYNLGLQFIDQWNRDIYAYIIGLWWAFNMYMLLLFTYKLNNKLLLYANSYYALFLCRRKCLKINPKIKKRDNIQSACLKHRNCSINITISFR